MPKQNLQKRRRATIFAKGNKMGYTYLRWDFSGEIKRMKNDVKRPNYQQTYREKQGNKGLVRYELQLPEALKARIEQLAAEIAQEYDTPYDKRRRLARARAQLFTELTSDTQHDFTQLKAQIAALKEELATVAPAFFIKKDTDTIPLPHAIAELPNDNPEALKQLIAKFYREAQKATQELKTYKERANNYYQLYEALTDENDRLRKLTAEFDTLPQN